MKVLGVAPPVRELLRLSNSQPRQKKSWQRFAAFFGLECGLSRAAAAVEGQAAHGGGGSRRPGSGRPAQACTGTRSMSPNQESARRPYRVGAADGCRTVAAAGVHAAWLPPPPPPRLPRGRRAAVRKTGFQGCVAFLAFTSIISKEGQKMQFLELLCTIG